MKGGIRISKELFKMANEELDEICLELENKAFVKMVALQKLINKSQPMKINKIDLSKDYYFIEYRCPECESELEYQEQQYCDACGQALDWSED
jgi:rRNA maturation endonuclease Nob1